MNLTGLLPEPPKATPTGDEPLHTGLYNGVRAVAADIFTSINGHPYLRIQYGCSEGYATEYLYFTPAAIKSTLRKLVILGWEPEEDGWNVSRIVSDTTGTLTEPVLVQVTDIDYQGQETPRVTSLNGNREKTAKVLKFLSQLKRDPELVQTISEGLTAKLIELNKF